jgi:hypothetical protein
MSRSWLAIATLVLWVLTLAAWSPILRALLRGSGAISSSLAYGLLLLVMAAATVGSTLICLRAALRRA